MAGPQIQDRVPDGPERWAPTPAITAFSGAHRFLSNFWACEVRLDGHVYPSVEHAYQAAKTTDPNLRRNIREARSPGSAKSLGRHAELAENWAERRVEVMAYLIAQKFASPTLRAMLLATGSRPLVEGNRWGDRFWGVCKGTGTNHLGNLIMAERACAQGLARPLLALDLEGTIISNAVSCFVRPGAAEFLEWSRTRFCGVVMITAVPEQRARTVLDRLVGLGDLPAWVPQAPIIGGVRGRKVLAEHCAPSGRVLLVDDQATSVDPAEVGQWISVPSWSGPEADGDRALWDVRIEIDVRLAQRDAILLASPDNRGRGG